MDPFVQALSASCGGLCSSVSLHPLDTLKTRLQAQGTSTNPNRPEGKAEDGDERANPSGGVLATIREIHAEGGVAAFFKGVVPSTTQNVVEKFIYFFAYTLLREGHQRVFGEVQTVGAIVVGYLSEWAHLPVTLPMEVVAKRLMASKPVADKSGRSARSPSVFAVISAIFSEKGAAGFYRGVATYVALCLRPAIEFTIFGRLKELVLRMRARGGPAAGTQLTAAQAFFFGAISRAIATLLVYPFTRVKVMMQSGSSSADGQRVEPSIVDKMRDVVEHDGFLALYRGIEPEIFRGMLSSAIMLMVKERIYLFNRRLLIGDTPAKPATR